MFTTCHNITQHLLLEYLSRVTGSHLILYKTIKYLLKYLYGISELHSDVGQYISFFKMNRVYFHPKSYMNE